jgi:hypothetical protein
MGILEDLSKFSRRNCMYGMDALLSVIIPAYNDSRLLPLTLVDVDWHLREADLP